MTFRHLEAFVAVARKGGFTRAAEALHLTQPTISGQIKELEEELGTPLFHRLPRSVELTEAGRWFLGRAREILDARERFLEEAAAYRGLLKGTLEVHASTIPGEYLLPPVLARFKERHPDLRVLLRVADTGEVLRRVSAGEAGLGVVGERRGETGLSFLRLWRDRVGLFAPAGWAGRLPLTPEDLADLPLILREEGSGTRKAVEGAVGERMDGLRVVGEFGSTAAVLEAVRAGIGAGFLSERAAAVHLETGRIVAAPVPGLFPVERWFYAVWHPRRELAPAAAAFLALLREDARSGTGPPGGEGPTRG